MTLFSDAGDLLVGNLSIPRAEIISWPDVSFTSWSRTWRSQWKALWTPGLSWWISCRWSEMGPKGPIRSPCWTWLSQADLYFFLSFPLPTAHLCGKPPNWGTRVKQGEDIVLNGYSISSVVWGLAEINQTWNKLAPPQCISVNALAAKNQPGLEQQNQFPSAEQV